jgi:SAM-dependent methyltransferase
MNIPEHNREAWDRLVAAGNTWTQPVGPDVIAAARQGQWSVLLTPHKPVPRAWFGELKGVRVLGLASGGGQQGPVFAAAGATVTILDNSPAQLAQDRTVAEREGLAIDTHLGEMTDLSRFADGSFDLIFHPVANGYIPNVLPMWRECFRVLRPGGRLLAGFTNPFVYLFDPEDQLNERRDLIVRHKVPYSDVGSLPPDELRRRVATGEPLEFSHTLDAQIGGQLAAGFVLIGFYEDTYDYTLDRFISTYVATLAIKP